MRKATALPYYGRSAWRLLRHVRPVTAPARLLARSVQRMESDPLTVAVAGVPMRARGFMDLWVYKEEFVDDLYGRHGFGVAPGRSVIDAGAGTGEFTIHAVRAGARHVVSVEPAEDSVALLRDNLALNGMAHAPVDVVNAAVVAVNRPMVAAYGVASLRTPARSASPGETDAVPAVTLGELLGRLPEGRCDLLKIDCEGAEFEILGDSDPLVFASIDRVVLEYHESPGRALPELVAACRAAGYEVTTVESPVHRGLGYLAGVRTGPCAS